MYLTRNVLSTLVGVTYLTDEAFTGGYDEVNTRLVGVVQRPMVVARRRLQQYNPLPELNLLGMIRAWKISTEDMLILNNAHLAWHVIMPGDVKARE